MEVQLATALFFLPLFLATGFVQPFFFNNPFRNPLFWIQSPAEDGRHQPAKAETSVLAETGYGGGWELVSNSSGVSAMHLVITHTNKAIMFDWTNFGGTRISLAAGNCRTDLGSKDKRLDCSAHAVEYDLETGDIRPLKVLTNPWCSSGAFSSDGTLVQTGGWKDGGQAVRYLSPCDNCDWKEYPTALSGERWYSTQQILPDGGFILVGGRRQFGYEYVPPAGQSNKAAYELQLLRETTDEVEDNLYPFVHLSTDGNLFIFANNRSILLDPKTNKVVREFPVLKDGSRNYPASGMSALLPLNLQTSSSDQSVVPAEVIVCGGSPSLSAKLAGQGTFIPALRSCGRIVITEPDAEWQEELMPVARVMSDMLLLPNAEILIINGASKGSAGWGFAREPALEPLMYSPLKVPAERFKTLSPTTIPRMYHSSSAVLPDGRILVAGSNTNNGYFYSGVPYPTELRVEKFSPPYLDPSLVSGRPDIAAGSVKDKLKYAESFTLDFRMVNVMLDKAELKVTMYAPPFTTHGFSMNQRLLILKTTDVTTTGNGSYQLKVLAPPSAVLAPAGYYLVFVVHKGLPSKGVWVRIQ